MHSLLKTAVSFTRTSVRVLATLAIVALSMATLKDKAHALTISVGTNTVVDRLGAAPQSSVSGVLEGGSQAFYVIYATASSSRYSIMLASQTQGAGSGGAATGWTLTTLYSTTTGIVDSSVLSVMNGLVLSGGQVLVYYYDQSLGHLRVLSGNSSAAPLTPVSVASATVANIQVFTAPSESAVYVLYSSQAANGRYELRIGSSALASVASPLTSIVNLSTAGAENTSGSFNAVSTDDTNTIRVYYYDSLAGALREVLLNSANAAIEATRSTLDSGVITDITASDSGANGSGITRLIYTVGGATVRYAIQRRGISGQCWYIQKIDDGSSAGSIIVSNSNPTISYTQSGNLRLARGVAGVFFDDFVENIVNTQQGIGTILTGVTRGLILQATTGADRDRGIFFPSATNAIGTFNWTTLRGSVVNSFGTVLPAIAVADTVTGSAALVGSITAYSGAATLSPGSSNNTSGGITDVTGAYQINVGSGSVNAVSASSTSWSFMYQSSRTLVSVSTLVATNVDANGAASNLNATFIAFSSPVINQVAIDAASARISTFSVGFIAAVNGSSSTFNLATLSGLLSNRFTRSMNFRLVPQSTQGTAPTITVGTTAAESGSIDLLGLANEQSAVVSTTTIWARFSSTDTTNLPKYYTLVASSRTDTGPVMLGSIVDAIYLRPVDISTVTVTTGVVTRLPGYTSFSSTGLFNTSTMTHIVFGSLFSNIYCPELAQYGNVHLTTSTALVPGVAFAGDIPLRDFVLDARGSTVSANASIIGLNSSATWYVRISSAPAGSVLDNGQVAFSPSLLFFPPMISSVVAINNNSDPVIAYSSASQTFAITGSGFIGISTITFSTSTTLNTDNGMPPYHAGRATAFTVNSSTFMTVAMRFDPKVSAPGTRYHVYYGTATVPGAAGTYSAAYGGVLGSTILVNSTSINAAGVILVSTPAIVSVDIPTVSNTRIWTLTLRGRGLLAGSTVSLFATDGSTALPPVATNEVPEGGTGIGLDNSTPTVTITVDFRTPVAGGKTFFISMSSLTDKGAGVGYVESSSNTLRIVTGGLITCSSMTAGVLYPDFFGAPTNTVFNSTASVRLRLSGLGLIQGTTLQIVNVSSAEFVNQTAVDSATGAFATFLTTSIFKASPSVYTVNLSTTILIFGGLDRFSATVSTTISISAASILTAALASHSSAVSTLMFATYTITGTGLLPNVTFFLNNTTLTGHDRIGAVSRSTGTTADWSSLNLAFDLRNTSATSSSWEIAGRADDNAGSTMTLTNVAAGALTISTIVTLGVIPSANRPNSGNTVLNLTGNGLITGATVALIYTGTALAALQTTNGATDYVGINPADTNVRIATISATNGAGVASQSTATVFSSGGGNDTPAIDLSRTLPSTSWVIQVTTVISGSYSGVAPQSKDDNGTGQPLRQARSGFAGSGGNVFQSNASTFTVSESSAPNKVTGLTVLSAGTASVTLRWISPGDDGEYNPLTTGSNYIVYYSSGNGHRGTGCAPCYPLAAVTGNTGGVLEAGASYFTFAQTWAQYLPAGHADAVRSTDPVTSPRFADTQSSTSVRGLVVSTQTLAIASVTVKGSTNATGSTGATSINPGQIIEATLTIDAGTTAGEFFFVVRAQDESGNLSPASVVYATASAIIGASAVTVTDTIDPNATTILAETDLGGGVASGGTIPPGALDGSDTMLRTADTNPPADSAGVDLVGPAVDITLGSGKTEFKKAITLTFTLTGAALAEINSKTSNFALVKVAFFNGSRWVLIRESSFDGTTVTCQVTHLTKFGVAIAAPASNLSQATVYPNPFRPTLAAQSLQGITFDSVPANTTISIYTLAGDLVKMLKDDNGDGMVAWNAKNEDGQDVASGVYFALLKGAGDTKTLKVAVQR